MLKLNASYGKKIPVPGEDYSSQSYHCAMEVELSDNATTEQLQTKIHDTFAMVKDAVETELQGKRSGQSGIRVLPDDAPSAETESVPAKASDKQIGYLITLSRNRGLNIGRLNDRVHELFGIDSVYLIDRKQASSLIDELKAAA